MKPPLEPLQALKELKKKYGKKFSLNDDERCRIIEFALKDYEKPKARLDDTQALEIVKRWKAQICWKKDWGWEKELSIVENELIDAEKYKKALKIIKEHRLDIDWFLQFVKQDITYKTYVYCVEQSDNKFAKRFLLSEEEYELLKEILK